MTFSPGPASFIRGPKSASPSNTRGGSRVPEWGPLGSVRGALSNERPYRDLANVALTQRDLHRSLLGVREKSLIRKCSVNPRSSPEITKNRHFRVRVLHGQPRSPVLRIQRDGHTCHLGRSLLEHL